MLADVPEDIYFSILEFCDSLDHAHLMVCNRSMLAITASCSYRQFIELFDPPKDSPVVPRSLGDLLTMVNLARRSTDSLGAARDACNLAASHGLTKFISGLIGHRKWAYEVVSFGALTFAVRGGHYDTLRFILNAVSPSEVYSLVNPSSKHSSLPSPLAECALRAVLDPGDVRTGEMAKLLLEYRADVVGDPAIEQSCPLHLLVRKAKDAKKGGHSDGYLATSKVIVGYLANQCAVDYRVPVSPLEGPGVEHQKLVEVVTKALSSACCWEDETLIQCIIEGFVANEASRMWLRAAIKEAHSRSRSEILNASNGYGSGLQSRRILLMESSACPLFLAVTASGPLDRTERIIALLLKVCDLNVVLPSGKSPLYLACEIGASDSIIRTLLLGGAKVDMCTCSGRNALFAAVEKGYFAAVETLCSTGRCVNLRHITQRTNGGVSPFMLAENKGRLQMMLAMLEAYTREARISIDMFGADSAGSMSKLAATVTHPYLNKMCHKYRAKLAARGDSRHSRGRSMQMLDDHKARPKSAAPTIKLSRLTPTKFSPLKSPLTHRSAVRGYRMGSRPSHVY